MILCLFLRTLSFSTQQKQSRVVWALGRGRAERAKQATTRAAFVVRLFGCRISGAIKNLARSAFLLSKHRPLHLDSIICTPQLCQTHLFLIIFALILLKFWRTQKPTKFQTLNRRPSKIQKPKFKGRGLLVREEGRGVCKLTILFHKPY